jgi:hypothetical protein
MVHILWQDDRDGNAEIYYKRSTDSGVTWGPDYRLTSTPDSSGYPSVAVSGSTIHVAWQDHRDGNNEIYYKHSTDGGATWTPDTRLTFDSAFSSLPSVAVAAETVHVVWRDDRSGNPEIYYKVSYDGGMFWSPDVRLTNEPAFSGHPSVAVSSKGDLSWVHVVWCDQRDGNAETYYKRSTNQGMTWGSDTRLTQNPLDSWYHSVGATGSKVQVVWQDNRNLNEEIYYKHSLDGGMTWESDTRLTNATGESYLPSLATSGSKTYVVWHDRREGTFELYFKRHITFWEPEKSLTFDSNARPSPTSQCLAASGDTVYISAPDLNLYQINAASGAKTSISLKKPSG